MVPIRARTTQSTSKVTVYAAVIASLALVGIYLLSLPKSGGDGGGVIDSTRSEEASPRTALLNQGTVVAAIDGIALKNKEQLDEKDVDPMKITEGSVTYGTKNLPYYHCGPLPSHDNPELTELVLLHGAAFTKGEVRHVNLSIWNNLHLLLPLRLPRRKLEGIWYFRHVM